MAVLSALGAAGVPLPGALLWWLLRRYHPFLLRSGLLSSPHRFPFFRPPNPSRTTFLFAIGQDNANGRIRLSGGELAIDWAYSDENQALVARMGKALDAIAGAYGGPFRELPTWRATHKPLTVHSLGGCHLADTPSDGVVSAEGQVFGYDGLFIADGSVIPTSIGFHPVMTIAAVAERIAEHVVAYANG
jgi:cholesterol oxidase